MSKSLYDLTSESLDLTQKIIENGGELTPELEKQLVINETNLACKVDNYVTFVERLEMEESYWRKKAAECDTIARGYSKANARLRDNIKNVLLASGKDEIKGNDYRYKLTASQPSLVIDDEKTIPKEFTVVKTEINKTLLKEVMKAGADVPGAHLEPSVSLRAYRNKGE